jgi:endonuclease YncB( thermonuclease family)
VIPHKITNLKLKKALVIGSAALLLAGTIPVAKRIVDPGEMVTEVIDGDTFRISNKQTIRLFNVDTPPIEYCYGEEAKSALSQKILGKKVIIKNPRTDYWKRVEAHVYLPKRENDLLNFHMDGEFINEWVARNGFGADHSDGSAESFMVRDAGNLAKSELIGIYSAECYQLTPPKKNCLIKGHIPYNTYTKTYIIPECRGYTNAEVERYRGEDWFCTEKEAENAGFVKSANCSKN